MTLMGRPINSYFIKMKIGIFLSCYNSEDTIQECIDSILTQTYSGFNLYIFDDNSKDNTVKEIKKNKDKRIKLICSEKNMGTYASKNFLFKQYGHLHKYIALHDADDISIENRLEEQADFLNQSCENTACCGTNIIEFWEDDYFPHTVSSETINEKSRKNFYPPELDRSLLEDVVRYLTEEGLYQQYMKTKFCMNGSLVFKSEVLRELGGWDGKTHIAADADMLLRILGKYRIFNLQNFLYKRRFSSTTLTASAKVGISSETRKQYNLSRINIPQQALKGRTSKENFYFPEFNYQCVQL